MARPNDFINRFRYAILAILIVATIGYGWYLYRMYVPAQPPAPPPSIAVAVLADGSVVIDGVTYANVSTLKPKLAAIEKDHPGAGYSINAPRGQNFEGIAKAVVLMQQSGAKTIWVINEPEKKSENLNHQKVQGALDPEPRVGFITEPRNTDQKK
jgi:biopolymer transport protein ExbD